MLRPASVKEYVPLSSYTVFRIGGPARYFAEAATKDELRRLLQWAREEQLALCVLGAGSNALFSDSGFDGLVLRVDMFHCAVADNTITADAGVHMAQLVNIALKNRLSGIEWAIGVPGTVGGSVYGNAGCFGGDIKQVLRDVEVINIRTGEEKTLTNAQCAFAYRHSYFKEQPDLLIFRASFALRHGDSNDSIRQVREYTKKRVDTQDIGQQCAGCMFKNVAWSRRDIDRANMLQRFPRLKQFSRNDAIPAGFLIDELGLKGFCVGRAGVSAKHANYVINRGGATAEETIMLMSVIKERVRQAYGIYLENEVRLIGFTVSCEK